ncbi:unnamed protein product [Acanthoscelides obtectus]|uniref:Uncharacterized protein n=1 Tax=Acanthoscelides obtectus TaxID=200917 RepID=A0A9P0KTT3_ACAOB|nr:unnamed protein product [Acanthoscelides obtectus]CAK1633686.1 hypothetical protein AOBTE_LOCUS8320 [Acanthoscelides obtectus]
MLHAHVFPCQSSCGVPPFSCIPLKPHGLRPSW